MGGRYTNGRYPLSLFVHRGDNIYLTPSLNARWDEAVRIGLEKYGVRLRITGDVDGLGGWNGYRPFDAQVRYKSHYGRFAAGPGFSSHGGQYQGREVFAADVENWQMLAPNNSTLAWSRFVAIMRTVGLTVDFVTPREQWHVGDFNNPWAAPVFGALTINTETTNRPVQPEEDMTMKRLMQIDPKVDGRWFVIDYLAGTAVRLWNGFQLDRCREDVKRGELVELSGPQTPDAIQRLTIING